MQDSPSDGQVVLGFFGTRYFDGDRFYELIATEVAQHQPAYIVTSGESEGVSMLARRYARKEGIPLIIHFLARRHGRGMHDQRSKSIARDATHLIIIHDGQSTGTTNELAITRKMDKPYTYHLIERAEVAKPLTEAPCGDQHQH